MSPNWTWRRQVQLCPLGVRHTFMQTIHDSNISNFWEWCHRYLNYINTNSYPPQLTLTSTEYVTVALRSESDYNCEIGSLMHFRSQFFNIGLCSFLCDALWLCMCYCLFQWSFVIFGTSLNKLFSLRISTQATSYKNLLYHKSTFFVAIICKDILK